jgi:hypothetical protein
MHLADPRAVETARSALRLCAQTKMTSGSDKRCSSSPQRSRRTNPDRRRFSSVPPTRRSQARGSLQPRGPCTSRPGRRLATTSEPRCSSSCWRKAACWAVTPRCSSATQRKVPMLSAGSLSTTRGIISRDGTPSPQARTGRGQLQPAPSAAARARARVYGWRRGARHASSSLALGG